MILHPFNKAWIMNHKSKLKKQYRITQTINEQWASLMLVVFFFFFVFDKVYSIWGMGHVEVQNTYINKLKATLILMFIDVVSPDHPLPVSVSIRSP